MLSNRNNGRDKCNVDVVVGLFGVVQEKVDLRWLDPGAQAQAQANSLGVFLQYTSTGLLNRVVRSLLVTFRAITCAVSGLDELELARALHRVGTLQPGSVVDCGLSGSIRRPCWNPIRPLLQVATVQL